VRSRKKRRAALDPMHAQVERERTAVPRLDNFFRCRASALGAAAVGALDQFAKATFAVDTPEITGGAIVWEGPKEIGLTEVRLDGLLVVKEPERVVGLPAPWSDAARHADVVVEIKMPGDHLHPLSIRRAELRRAAWHVRRNEERGKEWEGSVGMWQVAPHVPDVLRRLGPLHRKDDGCYALGDPASGSWWIAANELPLDEALIPLLIARSGAALDAFARWVVGRRSPEWLTRMLKSLPMNVSLMQTLLDQLEPDPSPEEREREDLLATLLLKRRPWLRAKEREQDRKEEARRMLRRVLARRGLAPSPEQEARIDGCHDLETLERWHDQAVTAASAEEALA
jgi:hypothetical protein